MKITIIHGQSHQGSTYHIARLLANKLSSDITEFFLPRDFSNFCVGCTSCFTKGHEYCPHYEKLKPITDALDEADVIILASPVYVFHVTGGMKNLLDHYGYRWSAHSPEERMFFKQGVAISTAAGAGTSKANKDMIDSLFNWGVARIYKYGKAVRAINWKAISEENKKKIDKSISKIASKIMRRKDNVKPSLKSKLYFEIMRLYHRHDWNIVDKQYWNDKGWLNDKRPWKKK